MAVVRVVEEAAAAAAAHLGGEVVVEDGDVQYLALGADREGRLFFPRWLQRPHLRLRLVVLGRACEAEQHVRVRLAVAVLWQQMPRRIDPDAQRAERRAGGGLAARQPPHIAVGVAQMDGRRWASAPRAAAERERESSEADREPRRLRRGDERPRLRAQSALVDVGSSKFLDHPVLLESELEQEGGRQKNCAELRRNCARIAPELRSPGARRACATTPSRRRGRRPRAASK